MSIKDFTVKQLALNLEIKQRLIIVCCDSHLAVVVTYTHVYRSQIEPMINF